MEFWTKALEHAPQLVISIVGMLAMAWILSRGIKAASTRCHDVTDRTLDVLKEVGVQMGEHAESGKETREVLRELHHAVLRLNGKAR